RMRKMLENNQANINDNIIVLTTAQTNNDVDKDDIEKSDVLERLELEEGKYFVVSAHREENISSEVNFLDLVDSLNAVAEKYNMALIVSTHPRTRKMIEAKGIEFNPLVKTMKPLGFNDYVKLQMK